MPHDLSSNVHSVRGDADVAWLAVFEDELALALADYAAARMECTPTDELADYIAYLDACVTTLAAASTDGLAALASIARFARIPSPAAAGGFSEAR